MIIALESDKRLSKFRKIIQKGGLDLLFEDYNANITVFAPINDVIPPQYEDTDILTARTLVWSSILPQRVDDKTLLNNKCSLYQTKSQANPMLIQSNYATLIVNNSARVIDKIEHKNGIIYLIDDLTVPYVI